APQDQRIEFRMGVNVGDVIVLGEDIFGDGVNVAARLEGIATPGGITISGPVRDHIGNRLDLAFEDMGEQTLKNIERPIRVYRVRLDTPGARYQKVAQHEHGEKPAIAVLPFNNMSGDPEQEYFSDGITEDIITDLSKVSGLLVIARNTAFTYKGKAVKVQQVAQELGVPFILEGSVRKAGARVRVTAQLISSENSAHVWADRYDRELTDIFAIQDEITHAIVDQLKVKLLPQEKKSIKQTPTDNVEAYTFYLRGRQFIERRSKAYYQLARQMFAKAVELDPLYARAYAGIADCDSFLFLHYHLEAGVDSILATSAKALALDNRLAEAHASRGLALSLGQQHEEAIAEFEEATALDPNSFEAHYFYARAWEWAARALAIDPDDVLIQYNVACVYSLLGDLEQAFDLLEGLLPNAGYELKRGWIKHDSDLDPLRSHPRFQKILEVIERG